MNNIFQYEDKDRLVKKFFFLGLFSSLLSYIGYLNDIDHFYHSYLVSFMFWMTLSCGCMFFVMVHYTMNATWSVSIRRIAETSMSLIPYFSFFIIPLYFGMSILYEWIDHPLKEAYLNKNFFIIRTLVYLNLLSFFSRALYKHSIKHTSIELTNSKKMLKHGLILTRKQ